LLLLLEKSINYNKFLSFVSEASCFSDASTCLGGFTLEKKKNILWDRQFSGKIINESVIAKLNQQFSERLQIRVGVFHCSKHVQSSRRNWWFFVLKEKELRCFFY